MNKFHRNRLRLILLLIFQTAASLKLVLVKTARNRFNKDVKKNMLKTENLIEKSEIFTVDSRQNYLEL